jgi:hypothetical protein
MAPLTDGAADDPRHTDHRPKACFAGDELADEQTQRAAQDQQRRQYAARRPRTQCHEPYDCLHHKQQNNCPQCH